MLRTVLALQLVLFSHLSFGTTPEVILRCNNFHRLGDPQFQQGDEAFSEVTWQESTQQITVIVNQLAKTQSFALKDWKISRPDYSWLTGTGSSGTENEMIFFRFTYLGEFTWGSYFDSKNTPGVEQLCTETPKFQVFIDSLRQ